MNFIIDIWRKIKKNNIVIYTSKDGIIKVDTTLENETIWTSQNELAKLFNTTKNNISSYMKNIFESGELEEKSKIRKEIKHESNN